MNPEKQSNEQRYFDTLKAITKYSSPERLRREADSEYGLGFEEAIEMAYDNIQQLAKTAIGKRRRPLV